MNPTQDRSVDPSSSPPSVQPQNRQESDTKMKSSKDSAIQEISQRTIKGSVIMLVGTSSVGKSTVINALRKFKPDIIEENADLLGKNNMLKYIENNHAKFVKTEDWENLKNTLVERENDDHIHDAVWDPKTCLFKKGVSDIDRERAITTATALVEPVNKEVARVEEEKRKEKEGQRKDAGQSADIVNLVMDAVLEDLMKGHDTVFDISDDELFEKHALSKENNIQSVLIYCPFHTLTEMVAERNAKAREKKDWGNVRASTGPLEQFAKLFGPRQATHSDADVIDTVTKETVMDDFDFNFEAWVENEKRTKPEEIEKMERVGSLKEKRVEGKKALLEALGFKLTDPLDKAIELVPRKKYPPGSVINANDFAPTVAPEARAEIIAKKILGIL